MNTLKDKRKMIAQRDYSVHKPYIDIKQRANWRLWVKFDFDDNFPSRAYDMCKSSPVQSAIIENLEKYVYGAGLKDYSASVFSPNISERWEDFIKKCITDYCIFNAFAVQAILNEDGNKFSYYHVPVTQVRLGAFNEENVIETAYLCTDWTRVNNSNVVELKMWGSEQPKKGERYLMYFKDYKPDELYYAIPSWWSSANWVLADIALSKYYNNYIRNNFSANLSVRFPCDLDEDRKKQLYDMLTDSFSGEENAGNILLLFGENGTTPEVSSIESVNADLYNSVTDTVLKYIVSANRLTSPILAGLSTSSGFSSKSDEIIAAYTLYKLTVVDAIRTFVMEKINYLLQLNGYPRVLQLQDYDFRSEFEGQTVANDEKEAEQIDSDNEASSTDEQIEEREEQL